MDSGTESEVDDTIATEMISLFGEMKIEIDDKMQSYITGNEPMLTTD